MSELEMRNHRAQRYRRKLRRRRKVMYERAALLSGILAVVTLVIAKGVRK